ncbi:MAG: hypothetical protein AB8G15_15915 [Saprospiraceae bacterium]
MRLIINLFLIVLCFGLVWVLYSSIREPIKFKAEKEMRDDAVIAKLIDIRKAQDAYRSIKGKFASDFDSLAQVLTEGKFAIIQVFGDPDDPTNTAAIRYDTIYKPAIDSMRVLGINLDSLRYVPYGEGSVFDIKADTMTYQKTLVNVVEVGVRKRKYMGEFADAKYQKYDHLYDPDATIKFGNMGAPNLSGNWER